MKYKLPALFLLLAFCTPIAISGLVLVETGAVAQPYQPANPQTAQPVEIEPANYCLSCHTAGDPQLADPTAWRGGIERTATNPCPAARRIHEELYYTERLLLAIDRARLALVDSSATASIDSRLIAANENYARLLDAPITSLNAFTSEAQNLRFRLGKIYAQLTQLFEAQKRQRVLIWSGVVTLALLAALGWGIYNTRKFTSRSLSPRRTGFFWRSVLLVAAVAGLFALPLFRQPLVDVASANVEITNTLYAAQRVATVADRTDGRLWMFSRIASAWHPLDPTRAETILDAALDAAALSQTNTSALWGEAALAQEVAVGEPALLEKGSLIAGQLNAVRGRLWARRLIAAEWSKVDAQRAEEILDSAAQLALAGDGIYRDLDLRGIAVEWAKLDPLKGIEITRKVTDPAIRAWGLREIAVLTKTPALFTEALQAAREIGDPVQRARELAKIGGLSGNRALFTEAASALEGQTGAVLAYALSDLAVAAQDAAYIGRIEPGYPEAQAAAWLGLGETQKAWEAALLIRDPYEQAHAQAQIGAAWAQTNPDQAKKYATDISVPVLRQRLMRDVISITGDESLVQLLNITYYRVQALTALQQYQAAWEAAADLKEAYPLVGLGIAWLKSEPSMADAILERLSREADKSAVLNALAAYTGDANTFERALGMALAARVPGDALAPAEASMALGLNFLTSSQANFQTALEQAYQITERISIK
jgi:hypothetical protein